MRSLRPLMILVIASVLTACGNQSQTELKEWMREEAKGMRGKVPPLPEITPFPAVAYVGRSLIIPFSPQKVVATEAASGKTLLNDDRPRQPLENFPLEDLRITGVIVRDGVQYALIAPPSPNKPMHVSVGDYMGRNFGRITSITTDAVTILETTKDNSGAWIEKDVIKPIPRQGGKK